MSDSAQRGTVELRVGHHVSVQDESLILSREETPPWRDLPILLSSLRYGFREFADAGGLMSYGYNLPDAYRQMARLVVKILKGDRPSDLPFERPARYELIVNLKAAKAIGLTIPDPFVLLADEVIE
jgi:ABC transporter substrate binding protein